MHPPASRFRGILQALALALALAAPPVAVLEAATARVTRGPYLQLVTTNSVVVRWRTDLPEKAEVRYGPGPEKLVHTATVAGELTEHIVRIGGLQPGTKYFYSIGAVTNRFRAGGTDDDFFVTAPAPGDARPTRVWVIGDAGTATTNQVAVRDAFYRLSNRTRRPDLWLMLGDNAYSVGSDAQYQKAVFDMYAALLRNCPVWPTLGNHDAGSASSDTQSGVYYDSFTLPTLGQAGGVASGTEAYYSFDRGNVHFICLDSHDTDRSADGAMARWLRQDLEEVRALWVIAYFHHPPYTKGSHDSDKKSDSGGRLVEMREHLVPILERGGVDLVLAGHSHSYERSHLIDGHYGYSSNLVAARMIRDHGDGREDGDGPYRKGPGRVGHEGAVYVVAGSSGQTSGGPLNHPVMYLSLNRLGSLVLDIDGPRLDAEFIDHLGRRRDYFTLRKER